MNNRFVLHLEKMPSNAREMSFIWVPPARFTMGANYASTSGVDDDLADAPFEVELSNGFWISQYLVTQAQWLAVFPHNPSHSHGMDSPVEQVNWHEARFFAKQLSSVAKQELPGEMHFDLPSEAQWEYACTAGSQIRNPIGETETDLDACAWYGRNSGGSTKPVGLKQPNTWQLFDMIGNVSEWCRDGAEDYPTIMRRDWEGMNYLNKIVRGGSSRTPYPSDVLTARGRSYMEGEFSTSHVGFRLVLQADSKF